MRGKRINSDIDILFFFFASGASDFTQVSRTVGQSTGRSRLQGTPLRPPEWWQFEGNRATAMTIETKVSERAVLGGCVMSKNGTILIAFAWAMEIVGVAGGVINSIYTTFGEELPNSFWGYLPAVPMVALAVAEL